MSTKSAYSPRFVMTLRVDRLQYHVQLVGLRPPSTEAALFIAQRCFDLLGCLAEASC